MLDSAIVIKDVTTKFSKYETSSNGTKVTLDLYPAGLEFKNYIAWAEGYQYDSMIFDKLGKVTISFYAFNFSRSLHFVILDTVKRIAYKFDLHVSINNSATYEVTLPEKESKSHKISALSSQDDAVDLSLIESDADINSSNIEDAIQLAKGIISLEGVPVLLTKSLEGGSGKIMDRFVLSGNSYQLFLWMLIDSNSFQYTIDEISEIGKRIIDDDYPGLDDALSETKIWYEVLDKRRSLSWKIFNAMKISLSEPEIADILQNEDTDSMLDAIDFYYALINDEEYISVDTYNGDVLLIKDKKLEDIFINAKALYEEYANKMFEDNASLTISEDTIEETRSMLQLIREARSTLNEYIEDVKRLKIGEGNGFYKFNMNNLAAVSSSMKKFVSDVANDVGSEMFERANIIHKDSLWRIASSLYDSVLEMNSIIETEMPDSFTKSDEK